MKNLFFDQSRKAFHICCILGQYRTLGRESEREHLAESVHACFEISYCWQSTPWTFARVFFFAG